MNINNLSLAYVTHEPREKTSGAPPLLLLLHGIGSNEEDLFGLAPYLDGRFLIISARAPVVMGPGAYGWFNIEFTPQGMAADLDQAERSLELLSNFVGELTDLYGGDGRRVYLMGFSQGAMMSLSLALTRPEKVAGVVAMSGRLPSQVLGQVSDTEALKGIPILITHGTYDPVLPIENGRAARQSLKVLQVKLTYREYPMGHEVSPESLRDVSAWLVELLDKRN